MKKTRIKILSSVSTLFLILILLASTAFATTPYNYAGQIGVTSGAAAPGYTLGNPVAISKDTNGNYFVADLANNRVVKLNSSMQRIATLDGIDMPLFVYVDKDNNVLVNELGTNKIKKYTNNFQFIREWGGPGKRNGQFDIPRSIVQDSKRNYYVSDELNHRIQKFDVNGNFLAAYGSYGANNGQFAVQQGLSIDSNDRLYVADTYNNRIQVFQTSPSWQHLKSFGTFGLYDYYNIWSYQSDIFNHPRGVYVEPTNNKIVVSDSGNNRVMVYDTYEKNFGFLQMQNGDLKMALPAHAILEGNYVTCVDSHSRIMKYYGSSNNTTLYNSYGTLRTANGIFSNAASVAVNQANGDIYVSDSFNHRIQRFNSSGTWIENYGYNDGQGGPDGFGSIYLFYNFLFPKQIAVDGQSRLYVTDFGNSRVVRKYGSSRFDFELVAGTAIVDNPWGVAVDTDNETVYISDWGDNKIKVVKNQTLLREWGGTGSGDGQFICPADIKIGVYKGQKAIFVVDSKNSRVQVFKPDGTFLGKIGEPTVDPIQYYEEGHAAGMLFLPLGIAIDANNNIIVSDTSHKRMQKFDSNGNFVAEWGTMSNTPGNFFSPMGCDINKNTGRLYVTDGVLQRLQFFDPAN